MINLKPHFGNILCNTPLFEAVNDKLINAFAPVCVVNIHKT